MSDKNIAVQLFGHLRSYKRTYKSFLKNIVEANIKNGYNIDIFIHTWNETDHSSITWHNWNGEKRGVIVNDTTLKQIKKIYNPKKILVSKQIELQDSIITEKIGKVPRAYKGVVNVAYTKYMSSELRKEYSKENNIKYDYIIVTRPDILFHSSFVIDDFLRIYQVYNWQIPQNGIFYGHNHFARGLVEDKYMIGGSDIIFFGSEYSIDKATNLYLKIKNNALDIDKIKNNFYCFEYFWYKHWLSQGLEPIKLKYFQFSDYNIIRNESEYESALKNSQNKKEEIYNLKVSSLDSRDNNDIYHINNKDKLSIREKIFSIKKINNRIILRLLFFKITFKEKNNE